MIYIARRMTSEKPNKVQMAVELAYDLTRNNITGGNIDDKALARKWFPFLAALFFFIWFSNMIGFLPLPINTEHKVDIFGLEVPSLALYAATANLSIPLVLTLIVWSRLPRRGDPGQGPLRLPEAGCRPASRT